MCALVTGVQPGALPIFASGANFANSASGILNAGAGQQANSLLAGGAIQAGAYNNIGQGFQNAASNYQFYNALNRQPQQSAWQKIVRASCRERVCQYV